MGRTAHEQVRINEQRLWRLIDWFTTLGFRYCWPEFTVFFMLKWAKAMGFYAGLAHQTHLAYLPYWGHLDCLAHLARTQTTVCHWSSNYCIPLSYLQRTDFEDWLHDSNVRRIWYNVPLHTNVCFWYFVWDSLVCSSFTRNWLSLYKHFWLALSKSSLSLSNFQMSYGILSWQTLIIFKLHRKRFPQIQITTFLPNKVWLRLAVEAAFM